MIDPKRSKEESGKLQSKNSCLKQQQPGACSKKRRRRRKKRKSSRSSEIWYAQLTEEEYFEGLRDKNDERYKREFSQMEKNKVDPREGTCG